MNKSFSVLHVYKNALPEQMGGVEMFIDSLCHSCNALGVESKVFALSNDPVPEIVQMNGYEVIRKKSHIKIASSRFSFSAFSHFFQLAQESDIIHYHFPWPFMDLLHFICRIQKPTIVTYHADILRQKFLLKLYTPLMNAFLRRVDSIIATSQHYCSTSHTLRYLSDKVDIIPIGLDKAKYPQPSDICLNAWRSRFKKKFYLFVGALRYYKGLHLLLEAVHGSDISVVIVGEGQQERKLKKQACILGLKNVHFLGYVSEEDKIALLTICYGFVFPSHLRSEAFGVALLEAAMYGKAMISFENGTGSSFINIHEKTGLVVPSGNIEFLRSAMQTLLDNPDKAYVFGQNAEKRYWQHFTAKQQAQSYFEMYQRLLIR